MKKRLISLLLAFSMALTFLPVGAVSAFAAETFTLDGITYTVTGSGTVSVTGYDNASAAADLVLPGTVTNDGKDYTVTAIGANAFKQKSNLTSIVIPKSVTTIGENAFFQDGTSYHGNLKTVTFEDGSALTRIEANAFAGCSNLQTIEIPENVEYIGSFAFNCCFALSKVTFKSGTAPLTLDDGVFGNTSSLKTIDLPERLVSVGRWLFGATDAQPGLTSIRLPESITKIPEGMFQGCTALETVELGSSVTEIDKNAFKGCASLKNIIYNGTLDQWNDLINSKDGNVFGETNNDKFKNPETLKYLCRVTFDTNGLGTAPEAQQVYVNELLKPFQNPTAAGYTFTGWLDEDGNPFDVTTPVTKDMALTAQWVESTEPGTPADGSGCTGGAIAAGVAIGGAAAFVGYEFVTDVILSDLLPAGASIPVTRAELARLVWDHAGRPEPVNAPAFADVDAADDADTAKAAQWCTEQGLLKAVDGRFLPGVWVPRWKVIQVWNKAFPKN